MFSDLDKLGQITCIGMRPNALVLDQINTKRYDQAFILRNKKIVKVGLNFTVKDEVNTLEWIIE